MSLIESTEAERTLGRRLDRIHLKLQEAGVMVKLAKQAHLQHLPSSSARLVAKLREVVEELDELTTATVALQTQGRIEGAANDGGNLANKLHR